MKKLVTAFCVLVFGILLGLLFRGLPVSIVAGNTPLQASQNGDVNGDGFFDIADPLYMLFYMFQGGPEPVACAQIPTDLTALQASVDRIADAVESMVPTGTKPCSAAQRFANNGDGTVTDQCLNLMWSRETVGSRLDLENAVQALEELDLGGHTDWRLPTGAELESLLFLGNEAHGISTREYLIYPEFFVTSEFYWSSSASSDFAWVVTFLDDPYDKSNGGSSIAITPRRRQCLLQSVNDGGHVLAVRDLVE
jgi:hypothetical protein